MKVQVVSILLIYNFFLAYAYSSSYTFKTNSEINVSSIEEDIVLYKYLEDALTTDYNLYVLQDLFYPHHARDSDYAKVEICVIIHHINDTNDVITPGFKHIVTNDSYILSNKTLECSEHGRYSDCYVVSIDTSRSTSNLGIYLNYVIYTIGALDPTCYGLLYATTEVNVKYNFSPLDNVELNTTIFLNLNTLPKMPTSISIRKLLLSLLTWIKFYARTVNLYKSSNRQENDQVFVYDSCFPYDSESSTSSQKYIFKTWASTIFIIGGSISLNFVIMISGLFFITALNDNSFSINRIEWLQNATWRRNIVLSSSIIATPCNMLGFIIDIFLVLFVFDNIIVVYGVINFTFKIVNLFIVTIYIHFLQPKFNIPCQIFVLTNLLLFAHRFFNSLVISAYFLAVAPSETLAMLALVLLFLMALFIIIVLIIPLCQPLQNCQGINFFMFIVLTFYLLVVVVTMVCFTLLFIDIVQHVLDISRLLVSVFFPLAIAFVTFLAGVTVKKMVDVVRPAMVKVDGE